MNNTPVVAGLTVGESDTGPVQAELEAIRAAFRRLGAEIVLTDPVSDADGARQGVEKLKERQPDLLLVVALRGLSAQAIEAAAQTLQVPTLLCPVQGRFALPSSALAAGALREAGLPAELVYAPPEAPEFSSRIGTILRAAKAYTRLRRSRVGVIGELFPNLVSCRYDPQVLSARLGTTLVSIPFEAVRGSIRRLSQDPQAIAPLGQEIIRLYGVQAGDRSALEAGLRLHLAFKQIARERQLEAFITECWSGFPRELGLNPCLGFVEDAYTLACEGDAMLCLGLLIARHLTGWRAYAGDLYDVDLDGTVTLVHCGGPASLAPAPGEVVLDPSTLARERGFETFTCRPRLEPGLVTLFRFYGRECDRMHLALGELWDCVQSPNLAVKVRLKGDRWDFLGECLGNHYVAAAGDVREEMRLLGKWFGITIIET